MVQPPRASERSRRERSRESHPRATRPIRQLDHRPCVRCGRRSSARPRSPRGRLRALPPIRQRDRHARQHRRRPGRAAAPSSRGGPPGISRMGPGGSLRGGRGGAGPRRGICSPRRELARGSPFDRAGRTARDASRGRPGGCAITHSGRENQRDAVAEAVQSIIRVGRVKRGASRYGVDASVRGSAADVSARPAPGADGATHRPTNTDPDGPTNADAHPDSSPDADARTDPDTRTDAGTCVLERGRRRWGHADRLRDRGRSGVHLAR